MDPPKTASAADDGRGRAGGSGRGDAYLLARHLEAEERHTRRALRAVGVDALKAQLLEEMRSEFLASAQEAVPERYGSYVYDVIQCADGGLEAYVRRRVTREPHRQHQHQQQQQKRPKQQQRPEQASWEEVLGPAEVLLDRALVARDVRLAERITGQRLGDTVGAVKLCPHHRLLAYSVPVVGRPDRACVLVRDTATGQLLAPGGVVGDVAAGPVGMELAADGRSLLVVRPDELGRPHQVLLHDLRCALPPRLLLTEDDPRFFLALGRTKDWAYLLINSNSKTSSEVHLLDAARPAAAPLLPVQRRMPGLEYFVEHYRPRRPRPDRLAAASTEDNFMRPPLPPAPVGFPPSAAPVCQDPGSSPVTDDVGDKVAPGMLVILTNAEPLAHVSGGTEAGGAAGEGGGREVLAPAEQTGCAGGELRLVVAPVGSPGRQHWRPLLPERPGVVVTDLDMFAEHCVLYERRNGVPTVSVVPLQPLLSPRPPGPPQAPSTPAPSHTGWTSEMTPVRVPLPPWTLHVAPGINADPYSPTLRLTVSSPLHPPATYDYHLASGRLELLAQEETPPAARKLLSSCTLLRLQLLMPAPLAASAGPSLPGKLESGVAAPLALSTADSGQSDTAMSEFPQLLAGRKFCAGDCSEGDVGHFGDSVGGGSGGGNGGSVMVPITLVLPPGVRLTAQLPSDHPGSAAAPTGPGEREVNAAGQLGMAVVGCSSGGDVANTGERASRAGGAGAGGAGVLSDMQYGGLSVVAVYSGDSLGAADPSLHSLEYRDARTEVPEVRGGEAGVHRAASWEGIPGPRPLMLSVYGAYGMPLELQYDPALLCMLARGWAVARVHVRGGGELGRGWHAAGRRALKQAGVGDCVAAAQALVAAGLTAPGLLAGHTVSAGGLVLGAALNAAPSLWGAAVLRCAFLELLGPCTDPDQPLTAHEVDEWGDPADPRDWAAMRVLCPYSNLLTGVVRPGFHTNGHTDGSTGGHAESRTDGQTEGRGGAVTWRAAVLASCAEEDPRVHPGIPAKWVARLRRRLLMQHQQEQEGQQHGRHQAARGEAGPKPGHAQGRQQQRETPQQEELQGCGSAADGAASSFVCDSGSGGIGIAEPRTASEAAKTVASGGDPPCRSEGLQWSWDWLLRGLRQPATWVAGRSSSPDPDLDPDHAPQQVHATSTRRDEAEDDWDFVRGQMPVVWGPLLRVHSDGSGHVRGCAGTQADEVAEEMAFLLRALDLLDPRGKDGKG